MWGQIYREWGEITITTSPHTTKCASSRGRKKVEGLLSARGKATVRLYAYDRHVGVERVREAMPPKPNVGMEGADGEQCLLLQSAIGPLPCILLM